MPEYQIFTDATCDVNSHMLAGLPHLCMIPMEVEIGGNTYTCGIHGNITAHEFYNLQRQGYFASTSQINPYIYETHFSRALQEGKDILYICFSSGMSNTINSAESCMQSLRERFPDRTVLMVDSLGASIGLGLFVMEALKRQQEGWDIHLLYRWLLDQRPHVCHWFTVGQFDQLYHGGRVSAAAASIGTMLQIRPLLDVDEIGRLVVCEKTHGSKKAMRALLSRLEQGWMSELSNRVIVGHGDCEKDAEILRDMIMERFPGAEVTIADIGMIIGTHTGPDMLALTYMGSNR